MSFFDIFKKDERSIFERELYSYGGFVYSTKRWSVLVVFDEDSDKRVINAVKDPVNSSWLQYAIAVHESEGTLFVGYDTENIPPIPDEIVVDDWKDDVILEGCQDQWSVYVKYLSPKQSFELKRHTQNLLEAGKTYGAKRVNYAEYIRSEKWRQKSYDAKLRAGNRCQVCNRSGDEIQLETHHRTYERLGNEYDSDLTVLCRDCHSIFEHQRERVGRKPLRVKP